MAPEREKTSRRLVVFALVGAAFLATVPLAMKWADKRVDDPATRRMPVTALGVTGLAKLRYGEHIEVFLDDDAGPLPDALTVPCIEDGGPREGTCTKEWSAVTEIAECAP